MMITYKGGMIVFDLERPAYKHRHSPTVHNRD